MPINADFHYQKAEEEYLAAGSTEKKILALKKMMTLAPKHKSAESLQMQLKNRLAKLKDQQEKEAKQRKGSGKSKFSIKKEGAATLVLLGVPNSGKSTLLKKLTGVDVKIAGYEFTTTEPVVGILDYHGIKIQAIEIPAIVKHYADVENGAAFLAIVRMADLVVVVKKQAEDISLIEKELRGNDLQKKILVVERNEELEEVKDSIWKSLDMIKVYTKQPGKKPDYPPIAFRKGATIQDLAEHVHKDFSRKFKFARVWGSAKFPGQVVGLSYKLGDNDEVELHTK